MCAAVSMSGAGVDGEILGRCFFMFRCYYMSKFFTQFYPSSAERSLHDIVSPVLCNKMLKKFKKLGAKVFEVRSNMARKKKKGSKSKRTLENSSEPPPTNEAVGTETSSTTTNIWLV